MTAKTYKAYKDHRLSEAIRRGIGSDLNRRSLSRVAAFQADEAMPERLEDLLCELEKAERRSPHSSH